MNRIKKLLLSVVWRLSYRYRWTKLFSWADKHMYPIKGVVVLPLWFHKNLYYVCMWLLQFKHCHIMANRVIHMIPYQIRFAAA